MWRRPSQRPTRPVRRWEGRDADSKGSGPATRTPSRRKRWSSGSGPTGDSPPTTVVELIDALTKDRVGARRFVINTLGQLAEADTALRQALLTYVRCGFNTTRAAANLYAHRNTVERRVSRANEISAVKVEDNPTHVAAALLLLDLAPDILATVPS